MKARLIALGLALGACTGAIRGGDDDAARTGGRAPDSAAGGNGPATLPELPPGVPRLLPDSFDCHAAQLGAQPLRRLGAEQYVNTVRDVLALAIGDESKMAAIWEELRPSLASMPDDERPHLGGDEHGTFRRLDQDLRQSFVDATYAIAEATAEVLVRPANLALVAGACVKNDGGANQCVNDFITRFGGRVLRRPIDARLQDLYRTIYGDTNHIAAEGFANVLGAMLASPEFLYLVEHGEEAVAGAEDVRALGAFELAARLSYHYWNTMPDQALWDAARDGAIADAGGYAATVDRVLADPRTRKTIDGFFGEYWLTEELPALDALNDSPAYKTFAGEDLPGAGLRGAMIAEVTALAQRHTWERAGTFTELLTSDLALTEDAALAAIYELPGPWNGEGTPPAFPAGTRPGFLTRAALLARDNVESRPVLRGALMRTRFLCDEVPPPPDNAMDIAEKALAALPRDASTRDRTQALTVESSTACAACHESMINPLGYALEGYDNLGRRRSEELIINPESGRLVARTPIDTTSVPRIVEDDDTPSRGPEDLVRLIAESGKAHACFARSYLRFGFGRKEDAERDACIIAPMTEALRAGAPLVELLRGIAFTPEFRQRRF